MKLIMREIHCFILNSLLDVENEERESHAGMNGRVVDKTSATTRVL